MEEERKQEAAASQEPHEETQADTELVQELLKEEGYRPRPTYQKVLAWALLVIVLIGIALWYLEIATAGSLFGLLG